MSAEIKPRFSKTIVNPATGRKKTIEYGQAGKAKDGKDRIRPGTKKVTHIALGLQKSREIGKTIRIARTGFLGKNGNARAVNR